MRVTISMPDEIYFEAKEIMGSRPFSDFVSEAIQTRLWDLKRERLAHEMEEGYRAEAEDPSLDADWSRVETDGL